MTLSERLYNFLIHVGLPIGVAGHYWAFGGRDPEYHTSKRFVDPALPSRLEEVEVWLHGASVGEIQLVSILRDWCVDEGVPAESILVTGQTASGLDSIDHPTKSLLPADYPKLLRNLTGRLKKPPLIVVETELWPNLFRCAPGDVHLFNGHLKPSTFERYCRIKPLVRDTLAHARTIRARSDRETRQFNVLAGPDGPRAETAGDLKWVKLLSSVEPGSLEGPVFAGEDPVLVAGSTWPGEEARVLDMIRGTPTKLYLAPRHLDRLDDVVNELENRELDWVRWTQSEGTVDTDVILVDEIGCLERLYGRGDTAFVGGSLVEGVGGHDLLEPARFNLPIFTGPHISNVRDTAERLDNAGVLTVLETDSDRREAAEIMARPERADTTEGSAPREIARDVERRYRTHLKEILGEQ